MTKVSELLENAERRDSWQIGRFDTSRFDTNSSNEIAQKIWFTLSIVCE